MKEILNNKSIENINLKYEIIHNGDMVWIKIDDNDKLLEKAWLIYCGLQEQDPEIFKYQKEHVIKKLTEGENLRPYGYGISILNNKILVTNQNGFGYQPNRDFMKKVIGY